MNAFKSVDRNTLGVIGIGLAIILFVAVNLIAATWLKHTRIDFTEDRLFTLSDGTKNILAAIDEPIHVRFYFSKMLREQVPQYGSYADRVRELLEQYTSQSKGKVQLSLLDPAPYSEVEDQAVSYGLQGVPVTRGGEQAYFGVYATNSTDDREIIPFIDPQRERYLEYDLTRMVYNLAFPKRKTVALLSSLPIEGDPMRGKPGWAIMDLIRQFFALEILQSEVKVIDPKKIDVLLVSHPQNLKPESLYAIDQFVLAGGRAAVFMDPNAEAGELPQMPGSQWSSLDPLLKAWGVSYDPEKFAADLDHAIRVTMSTGGIAQRQVTADYVSWLDLGPESLNQDDVTTNQLRRVSIASSGFFEPIAGSETTFSPLIETSSNAMAMPSREIRFTPNPPALMKLFKSEDRKYTLAARVTGMVGSAYPDGPPTVQPADGPAAEAKPPQDGAPISPTPVAAVKGGTVQGHLAQSQAPINVVLVGDSDMLIDRFWMQAQDFLGQRMVQPTSNNGDFLVNVLDNLTGSSDLISLRGRGFSVRPFELVEDLRRNAELKFRETEQELQQKIEGLQRQMGQIQSQSVKEGGAILTEEQRESINTFRSQMLDTRAQLRQVQLALRQDIESLDTTLKLINIWAVPVVVMVIALLMAFVRRQRHRRHVRARD